MAVNKRKLLASAQRHIQKGSLDKALKDYLRLLEADPRDANVRLKVGDLQLRRNQPKEAIDAYLKVADQFMRDGFDAKAVAIYKQVTKIDGKRYEVYLPLAELYQRLGLVSEAMAALQSAADGYQQEGKRRDALDLLRKMSSLDPSNVPSRLKVADLLAKEELISDAVNEYDEIVAEAERQDDWETQIAVFERIVEVDPSRIESAQRFTHLLLERNQTEQAEHVARKCVEADPDRAESNELLAEVLTSLGKNNEAVPFFKRAAAAWRELGDEAKARDLVQRHVSDDDIDFGAEDLRNESGAPRPTRDDTSFGEVPLETDGSFEDPPTRGLGDLADPDAEIDLGFDADSNSESASGDDLPELIPEPVDSDAPPVDAEQLLAEASVYVRYGKHEKAIEAIQQVVRHEPGNAIAFEQMGDTLAAAGHDAPAVEAWLRAAKLLSPETDTDKIESLRGRIAERNEQAAAELTASPPPLHTPPTESSEPIASAADEAPSEPEEEEEIELVAPLDPVEDEAETPPVAESPVAATAAEAPAPADELDIDIDIDFDIAENAASPDTGAPQNASAGGASTSTSAQIAEELTEADSLLERSRLDDAERIYRRILDVAPNHPAAQLRLGELEAARARSEAEAIAAAEVRAAPAADDSAEPATEPDRQAAVAAPEDSPLDLESEIDLEAALAEAADAVDEGTAKPVAIAPDTVPDELPPLEAPGGDDASIEIEFDPEDDPDVSFAGLDPAPQPEPVAPEDAEAPLDFADEVEFGQSARRAAERSDVDGTALEPVSKIPDLDPEPAVNPGAQAVAAPEIPAVEDTEPSPSGFRQVEPKVDIAPLPAEPVAPAAEVPGAPVGEAIAEADRSVSGGDAPISFDVGEFDPDESFDLAAELSDALSEDAGATASGLSKDGQSGSLETLFSEFKRGVEQTLGEGDVETHFDLGIAYREMGLFDDAIGEFQFALGGENRRLDALHMMALCALDLGRPADATAHLEQALSSAEWPEDREAPLRFDLGRAYVAVGDAARALDTFRRVSEIDPTFGDVLRKIAALEGDGGDDGAGADAQETYESFDDLIDAGSEGGNDAEMESFEEFQDFDADDEPDDRSEASGDDPSSDSSSGSNRRRRKVSFI